jgi:uncharacterized protein involved in response to NO
MTTTIEEHPQRLQPPAVLTYAFRPLFLAAGSWTVVDIALWLAMFFGDLQLPTRFEPMAWHIHEMLFGFVMAVVGGFLLTAIPNWTKRMPVQGRRLALLTGLWLLGRIACLISADLPAWIAVVADLSFPAALLAVATREIIASRNWRNLVMSALLLVFVVADLLMDLECILHMPVPVGLGWRLGLAVPIVLISIIGGRIIPNFTRNWLMKRQSVRLPPAPGPIDGAAVGLLGAGLVTWAIVPDFRPAGVILAIAALLNAWRLARWCGASTRSEPLLFILHVGYAWVVIGTALLGLSILDTRIPMPSAIHALTAGAIGVMILAVMPRVTLGHTERDLTADRATVLIFVLINAAAIARVAASWAPRAMIILLVLSAACWIAAFGLFEIVYGPMLVTDRPIGPASSA